MTLSKADSNDKNHANTRQTKGRILRAKDIIPGASKNNSEKIEQAPDIPKFDLAKEILAEQRKITAMRRKAPGRQGEVESISYAAERSKPALYQTTAGAFAQTSEQEQIISDIVARDIEELYNTNITN